MTTDLKAMYKKVHKDAFPETMTILLGDEKLVYHKRVWTLDNEEKGLRYGENPDQPAALYELREGGITCGGLRWRGPGQGIVSAMTEAQMIQAGKHPGKTNLTDVDNGANILQYLSERPAAIILKHNNTYLTAYAHNQSLLVKEDQSVKKGQKIAEMGSTDADRVKLHFEVRRQGKPVDPSRYLPSR